MNFSNLSALSDHNETSSSPTWLQSVPSILIAFSVMTFVTNALLILTYVRTPSLWTPFYGYLVNLSLFDLVQSLFLPLLILYLGGAVFNQATCNLMLYTIAVLDSGCNHAHLLISLNRVWAIVFPVSYRCYHTMKFTIVVCTLTFLYVNLLLVPTYLVPYYMRAGNGDFGGRCVILDPMFVSPKTGYAINFIGYLLPQLVQIINYLIVCFKMSRRRQISIPTVSSRMKGAAQDQASSKGQEIITNAATEQGKESERKVIPVSMHFAMFTASVLSVTICWTPHYWFFTLRLNNVEFMMISTLLFYVNGILNPVIYAVSSKKWQEGFRHSVLCR